MSVVLRHCRLCAGLKEMSELIDLSRNLQIRNEIIEKLAIFSVNAVDFTDRTLPETVCTKCKHSTCDIYDFFMKIQHSQISLANERNKHFIRKIESSNQIKDEAPYEVEVFVKCDTVKTESQNGDNTETNFVYEFIEASVSHTPDSEQKLGDRKSFTKEKQKTEIIYSSDGEQNIDNGKSVKKKEKTETDLTVNDCSDDDRFQCTACGESFQSWKELQHHTSTDKDNHPKKRKKATIEELTCDICNKVFDLPGKLRAHKLVHSTNRSRDYVCDVCGKAFYSKNTFRAHRMIHNPETQVCKICKVTFISLIRLRKHLKTHETLKQFECDNCHRKFKLKHQLAMHMAVHSDILPHSCEYCQKRFRYRNTLKIHENTHTGAKPFVCTVCGKDFGNWSNCNKHMVRKHGVTLAKRVRTAYGMMPLNQETLKPKEADQESVKWSEQMKKPRQRGRKKQNGLKT